MAERRTYTLVGDDTTALIVETATGDVAGCLYAQSGGWWRGLGPSGGPREFLVGDEVKDPRTYVARRLIGTTLP